MKHLILFVLLAAQPFTYSEIVLVRVVDGDTVRLDIQVAPKLWYRDQSCRLLRVDAPEMNTAAGKQVSETLTEFLRGKKLSAAVHGKDRYGRFLIEMTAASGDNAENVSDWLLRNGHASRYELPYIRIGRLGSLKNLSSRLLGGLSSRVPIVLSITCGAFRPHFSLLDKVALQNLILW